MTTNDRLPNRHTSPERLATLATGLRYRCLARNRPVMRWARHQRPGKAHWMLTVTTAAHRPNARGVTFCGNELARLQVPWRSIPLMEKRCALLSRSIIRDKPVACDIRTAMAGCSTSSPNAPLDAWIRTSQRSPPRKTLPLHCGGKHQARRWRSANMRFRLYCGPFG
jgi:hypothetical protein